MIEIISAEAMWEKATKVIEVKARLEKQRVKECKRKTLEKAIKEIQDTIKLLAEDGKFEAIITFKEDRVIMHDEHYDEWYYLPDMIEAIIKIFTTAGYGIIWQPNTYFKNTYGNFKIWWNEI